mgnify:FL=1
MKVGDIVKVGSLEGIGVIIGFSHAWVNIVLNGKIRWEQSHIVEVVSESVRTKRRDAP